MSHMYFICDPSLTTLEQVKACKPEKDVVLSNTTHHAVQEALGFAKRAFVNKEDPNDRMETLYHTTIHDTEPVFVMSYELEDMLDNAYDNHPDLKVQLDWLYDLCEEAGDDRRIYIF